MDNTNIGIIGTRRRDTNADFKLVEDAFDALIKDGFSEDEAAEEISIMIFKDADIDKSQLIDDEK